MNQLRQISCDGTVGSYDAGYDPILATDKVFSVDSYAVDSFSMREVSPVDPPQNYSTADLFIPGIIFLAGAAGTTLYLLEKSGVAAGLKGFFWLGVGNGYQAENAPYSA